MGTLTEPPNGGLPTSPKSKEIQKLENYLTSLKIQIKDWEHTFPDDVKPSLSDIRSDESIASKYRHYQKYKIILNDLKNGDLELDDWKNLKKKTLTSSSSKKHRESKEKKHKKDKKEKKLINKEAEKIEVVPEIEDQPATNNNDDNDNDNDIIEIGPTPQLDGRVLGIFDIELKSVDNTPIKANNFKLNLTSPLKAIDNSNGNNSTSSGVNTELFKTPSKKVERKLLFNNSSNNNNTQLNNKSPERDRLNETPKYMRGISRSMSSMNNEFLFEDSNEESGDVHDTDSLSNENGSDLEVTPKKNLMGMLSNNKEDTEENEDANDLNSTKFIEPSPILNQRNKKSLFQINNELMNLKRNLKLGSAEEYDEEPQIDHKMIVNGEEEAEEEPIKITMTEEDQYIEELIRLENESMNDKNQDTVIGNDNNDNKPTNIEPTQEKKDTSKKRSKTTKRTTKRVKMKTINLDGRVDEFEDVDIHEKIKQLNDLQNAKATNDNDQYHQNHDRNDDDDAGSLDQIDDLTDDSDREDTYEKKHFTNDQSKKKKKGAHPLSNNFVRLKINNKKRGKFGNRRR